MESFNASTALLLIDVQKGFDEPSWGTRNNPQADARTGNLLDAWRLSKWPVYHIQHVSLGETSPLRPGQEGVEFKNFIQVRPHEPVIQKHVNSAFIGTDLEARLRSSGIRTLVIAGLTTDHCVSTTTRMAGNLGFEVVLVGDATATFDRTGPDGRHHSAQDIHDVHLSSLHGEFATVLDTAAVLERLSSAQIGTTA